MKFAAIAALIGIFTVVPETAAMGSTPPPLNAELSPPPSLPEQGSRAASPKDTLEWARRVVESYPIEAQRKGWEGNIGVTVTVTTDGRAKDCKVTQSSGYAILDEAACKAMIRHARFRPALDGNGLPTTGTYSTIINYRS